MGIKKMKAIELVLDYNLWPRFAANGPDSANVARLRNAYRTGEKVPPIVASAKDFRVTDGFHRVTAVLREFGKDAEISVELREYKNEAEMFLDAGKMNARHGMYMSSKDRAHFILRARSLKIPPIVIAEAIGMDVDYMKEFIAERSATTDTGEKIALPGSARNLAGKTLTAVQEHFVRHGSGKRIEIYINILINAIKADAVLLDERTIEKLGELSELIGSILKEAA